MTETKCTLSKVQYGGILGKRKKKCFEFSFAFIQTFGFLQVDGKVVPEFWANYTESTISYTSKHFVTKFVSQCFIGSLEC